MLSGTLFVAPYMALAMFYPVVWGWVTAILIAMLTGLFTARFIFDIRPFWRALALAPFLGCCWIGLF